MTWLDTWIGALLGAALLVRFGRDALRRAAAAGPADSPLARETTVRHGADRVPTWLLALLVVMILGPRLVVLLV